jgi:hypothetical protein
MSKTGNSLLHAAFQILGLRSLPLLHDIDAYDCQGPERPCDPQRLRALKERKERKITNYFGSLPCSGLQSLSPFWCRKSRPPHIFLLMIKYIQIPSSASGC